MFHACNEFLCSLHCCRVTHSSLIAGTTQNKDALQWKRKAGDNNGKSVMVRMQVFWDLRHVDWLVVTDVTLEHIASILMAY
jgi:hypothetical protein